MKPFNNPDILEDFFSVHNILVVYYRLLLEKAHDRHIRRFH